MGKKYGDLCRMMINIGDMNSILLRSSLLYFQETKVCDGLRDCPDGSDELCEDSCAPDSLTGKHIFKVRTNTVNQN